MASAVPAGAAPLSGTFQLAAGADTASGVAGSWFRMVQPGGSPTAGPFVVNGNSSAADQTYTFLSPGTDGGLRTAAYQPEPSPAFDAGGHSLAARIIEPTPFFGINFGVNTAANDAQTAVPVPPPAIDVDASGALAGDLRAFGASWNNQEFNQGSPKPDGGQPGLTAGPTGSYDSGTGQYVLDWTSLIVGGPFNGFTGRWHLTGTFAAPPGTPGGGGGAGGSQAAELLPTLVKVRSARTARFKRKAKRFVVSTGYRFGCPAGGPAGALTVRATTSVRVPARSSKRRTYVITRKSLSVPPGATVPVTFTVNRRGARLLRERKRLRVRFRVRAAVRTRTLSETGTVVLALR